MGNSRLTNIQWIGHVKRIGDEWAIYTKKFTLENKPDFAALRINSYGICGIYVNDSFLETSSGRYINRIMYVECTSMLHKGENDIILKLGSHYAQGEAQKVRKRRGAWFAAVAAELEVKTGAKTETITTDTSWICTSDEGTHEAIFFSDVNKDDYTRFWKAASLVREPKPVCIPKEITEVVGEEYTSYAEHDRLFFAYPKGKIGSDIYDFGRTHVGYVELEYEAERDGSITLLFDYSETTAELGDNWENTPSIKSCALTQPIQKGKNRLQLLHRRAFRYLRILFDSRGTDFRVEEVRVHLSMLPSMQSGWFFSSDELFNQMWEVGKYTLYVNKHQEYESCPRYEMKFFSGDGILMALVDSYAFGDDALVDASLSITEIDDNGGIRRDVYETGTGLWDYPAWRIIMAYNQYRYYKDTACVNRYYEELVTCLDWMIHRANHEGLIYQYPIWGKPMYTKSDCVDYCCSFDRLGEKPYLNALYYKSLICMAELAELRADDRAKEWRTLAQQVHCAFNERLWDEDMGAYLDSFDTSLLPQDGNALAVLFGLAEGERAKRALEAMKRENWSPYGSALMNKEITHSRGGYKTISPMMSTYEAEARFLQGDVEGAMDLLRRCWGSMLKKGAGTFWEFTPNNGHDWWSATCHGWSTGCTYLLSAYVLGIRPELPGYELLRFEPMGDLEAFRGVVPTVKGLVAVRCETVSGEKQYILAVPKGMELNIILPEQTKITISQYEA